MSRPWFSAFALVVALPLSAAIQFSPETVIAPPRLDRAVGTPTPLIASNGSSVLAAWAESNSTYALPLSRDGNALRGRPAPIDTPHPGKRLFDLATDGTNYVLLTGTASTLTTILVDASAQTVASTTVTTMTSGFGSQAQMAWNGEKYLLVYTTQVSPVALVGQFLNRRGAPIGEPFTIIATRNSPTLSVASNGRDFLIAGVSYDMCQDNACHIGLFTIPVSASGAPGALFNFALTNYPLLYNHNLRFTGQQYVLVWNDSLGNFRSVNEVPLDALGQPERPALVIATGDRATDTSAMTLMSTGNGAVALIHHSDKIRAVRIEANGDPIDPQPIDVFDEPGVNVFVDAASIGDDVLAVWTHWENSSDVNPVAFVYEGHVDFSKSQTGQSVAAAAVDDVVVDLAGSGRTQLMLTMNRVPAQRGDAIVARRLIDGVPTGESLTLIDAQLVTPITAVAANGNDFLVVSAEFDPDAASQPRAIRARLVHNGSAPTTILDLGHGADAPFAIWTGSHYLVTWTVTTGLSEKLMAIRISGAGELLDPAARDIVAAPNFSTGYEKIVSTPTGLVAIFLHGTPAYFRTTEELSYDVYAAHISADGDFISTPVPITNTPESEISTNVAVDPGGTMFVTWVEVPLDYHYGEYARGAVVGPEFGILRKLDFGASYLPRAVVWTGTAFVIGWLSDQVSIQRYSRNGDIDSEPIALTSDATSKSSPLLVPQPGGAFIGYTRVLPESSGSDAMRLIGRTIFDEGRRRAVTTR